MAADPLSALVVWVMGDSYVGLAAVMFLAGSVAPIPWELVLLPAGALGLDPLAAGLAGGLGASVGAVSNKWSESVARPFSHGGASVSFRQAILLLDGMGIRM